MLTVKRLSEFDDWLNGLKDGMTRIRLYCPRRRAGSNA
jgi:putative component of toxin-antitoxin plasmid stabilization module